MPDDRKRPLEFLSRRPALLLQIISTLCRYIKRKGAAMAGIAFLDILVDIDDEVLGADFDRVSAVTGQRCAWVVPAGSID